MDSRRDDTVLPVPGFPIRKSPGQSPLSGSPKLFAASHVLHRLLAPRHPPCALSSLTIFAELPIALSIRISLPVCNCQRPNDEPKKPAWIRAAITRVIGIAHPARRAEVELI